MRHIAASAIVNGDPKLGYRLASALLKRDPSDTEALVIRARAARDLGRLPEAIATARRAWASAQTPSERFGSAMVMAQSLSTSGARTRAQLWLRRAAQNAPNDDFKNIAIRDFRYVQRTNPWATEFSFGAAPNSNVNNGSKHSQTQLFDLPFEFQLSGAARALSGIEYNAGVASRYRFHESARSQNDVIFQLDHRTYTLSNEAKTIAPNAEGSDFEYTSANLSYIRKGFTTAGTSNPYQFQLTTGRTWYGQSPFMQFARVGATQNFVVAPGQLFFVGASREYQSSLSSRADVDSWGLRTGMRLTMANRDRLTLSINAKRSNSTDVNLDYHQVTLQSRYSLAKPIAGVSINFGLALSQKVHERSNLTRFGRQDQTMSFDVTGVFSNIEYYGFSPSATLSAQKTKSNIGLYDSQGVGFRLGIQSSF